MIQCSVMWVKREEWLITIYTTGYPDWQHSDVDGNKEERKSLLYDDYRLGVSTGSIAGNNSQPGVSHNSHTNIPPSSLEAPSPSFPPQVSKNLHSLHLPFNTVSHTTGDTAEMKVLLQTQLKRLHNELQSLGMSEIEVSYVQLLHSVASCV